jgi:hypothetical protein
VVLAGLAGTALAAEALSLAPLVGLGADPPAPWRVRGLPQQSIPLVRFAADTVDGRRALRVESDRAYGTLVHPTPGALAGTLTWRWRVDQAPVGADLTQRQGDDAALKVCALFAMPLSALPFVERQLLRLASARVGEPLPTATLCYVWHDGALAGGSVLRNVYTQRVRFVVVRGARGLWADERRDLAADFLRAFGDESRQVPPLEAVVVGADSDNTGSRSLAWIEGLHLSPPAR